MAKKTATKKLKNRVKIDATEIPMRPAPYLVVGPGRCGSSTVARLLHEHFNISMGYDFLPTDVDANPDGNYEDMHLVDVHKTLIVGKLNLSQWLHELQRIFHTRFQRGIPWGIKDPLICYYLPYYLYVFFDDNPRVIRCTRSKNLVCKSMVKHWKDVTTMKFAESCYDHRKHFLDYSLKNYSHLSIDFSKRISDKTIIKMIEDMWPDIYDGDWGCEA